VSAAFERTTRRAAFFIEPSTDGYFKHLETFVIMAEITAAAVKQLREKTGAGMMECKNALVEAGGDEEKAINILRERGLASAKKREGRIASEGIVGSYFHKGG
jgi:hypothetical protein